MANPPGVSLSSAISNIESMQFAAQSPTDYPTQPRVGAKERI